MFELIQPWVHSHGYWLVCVMILLESAGLPLPGETALLAVAIYAGASGALDIHLIAVLACGAAIVGDNLGFAIGRYWGRPLLVNHGHIVRLTPERLKQGEAFFARYGAKVIFFGRFVAFLRIYAALLAGANGYGWRAFLIYNAWGALVWSALFSYGGYMFGDVLMRFAGPFSLVILLAFICGVLILIYVTKNIENDEINKQ